MNVSTPLVGRAVVVTAVLATTLMAPALAPMTFAQANHSPRHPAWVVYNAKQHVAHLRIIAAYGQDTNNFDGGSRGALTFTVPSGTKVAVTFTNRSAHMPHGAEIVRYTGRLPINAIPTPAFLGAATPHYRQGTQPGITQHFHFVAGKPGTYLLICPVRNHVRFGHWDWFIVSKTATRATAHFK